MRKLLILALFFPALFFGQGLIPEELENLYGTQSTDEISISVAQKIKSDFYKKYYTASDSKGVFNLTFHLKNIDSYIDYLESEGFKKVYDIETLRGNTHFIVYTTERYQVIIERRDKEATVFDFQKRQYRTLHDEFYGGSTSESLRFGIFQDSPFAPSVEMEFIPLDKNILLVKVGFYGSDWIGSKTIKFSLDNGKKILSFPLQKIADEVDTWTGEVTISEKSSFEIGREDLQSILNSNSVKARIVGEEYFEYELTESQKYALSDFLKNY